MNSVVKGINQIARGFEQHRKEVKKATTTAIKVEAFRISKELKEEIRSGSPGGKQLKPLTFMARRRGKGFRKNAPLTKMANAIRYHMVSSEQARVGFTGPRVSESWKRIAMAQQTGFTSGVSDRQRRFFYYRGGELSPRSRNRKFLFIKHDTRTFRTPARPVIPPYWDVHGGKVAPNVMRNIKRKLQGERI